MKTGLALAVTAAALFVAGCATQGTDGSCCPAPTPCCATPAPCCPTPCNSCKGKVCCKQKCCKKRGCNPCNYDDLNG